MKDTVKKFCKKKFMKKFALMNFRENPKLFLRILENPEIFFGVRKNLEIVFGEKTEAGLIWKSEIPKIPKTGKT
jgi:hypothetical protein